MARQRGLEVLVVLLGYLPVTPEALAVVVRTHSAERLGHGAFGLAVVAQHLFQAVFGLRVAGAERRAGGGGGEDVRHAVLVAQDLDLLRTEEQAGGEHEKKSSFHNSHGSANRCGSRDKIGPWTASRSD